MAIKVSAVCDRCKDELIMFQERSTDFPPTKDLKPKDWMRGGHWDGLCRQCADLKDSLRVRQQRELESFMKMENSG